MHKLNLKSYKRQQPVVFLTGVCVVQNSVYRQNFVLTYLHYIKIYLHYIKSKITK